MGVRQEKTLKGTYRIADKVIAIDSRYALIHEQCRQYRVFGMPDFTVETTQADIVFEKEKGSRTDKSGKKRRPQLASDASLESLAVYRKIAERMPAWNTVLFHGSAIAVDGRAYLFAGRSGIGKSTHARLWRELLGSRAVMINDDKPLIRIAEDEAVVYGTPWDGKHHLSSNIAVSLAAVCFLEQADENSIIHISREEALVQLFRQTYRPADPAALSKTLSLTDNLSRLARMYRLRCNMQVSAAKLSWNTMKEG